MTERSEMSMASQAESDHYWEWQRTGKGLLWSQQESQVHTYFSIPDSYTVNLRVYGALFFRRQKSKIGGAPYTQVQDILSPQNATF